MNSQKVETAREALAELNGRFRSRELVGEAFTSSWRHGVSGALKKAAYLEKSGRTVVGIAELRIPAGAAVGIQQTLSRGHYTLNAAAETFKEFWTFSWLK